MEDMLKMLRDYLCACFKERNSGENIPEVSYIPMKDPVSTTNLWNERDICRVIKGDIGLPRSVAVIDMAETKNLQDKASYVNEAICIKNGRDDNFVVGDFPCAEVLFLLDCSPNFVSHILTKTKFPSLFRLYCNSDPGTFPVFHRHQHNMGYIGYVERSVFDEHRGMWWDEDISHIKPMTWESILMALEEYGREVLVRRHSVN